MTASALLFSALSLNLTLLSPSELKRQVDPSVFRLSVTLSTGERSSATGFLISESGRMVTNEHVIKGAVRIVAEDDRDLRIPVSPGFYARDPIHDLAIIQLDLDGAPKDFVARPVTLARDTRDLAGGHEVFVLGHPDGVKIAEFTRGDLTAIEPQPRRLRFNAAIHNGSSGSPMFDGRNGEVIGVVTSYFTGGAEINYATPVEYLHALKATLDTQPDLLPFRTAAKSPGQGRDGRRSTNLIISVIFFLVVIFGVRHVLRAAHR